MRNTLFRPLLASTALIGAAMLPGTVTAQSGKPAADPADIIIVTGSRIKRNDLQSSSPVAVITSEQLKLANAVTAEQFLNQNPQFVSAISGTTNNGADGTATADLRALGALRTLVLIDGRRMVPSGIGAAVDINAIPTVLIKRVEVLTGGASAVYGADAISGVVNFVLDDKFTGFTADGSSSVTTYGDAPEQNIGLAAGAKLGEHFHIVVAGQYTNRKGIYQDARAYSAQNLDANLKPSGSSNAIPTAIDIASGRYQINDGSQAGASGDFVPFYKPYNYNPANLLSTPLERYNLTAIASYEISPAAEIYVRGSYTRSNVTATLAPTATGGFNFVISPTNPYLSAQQNALIFGDANNLNPDGTANVAIRRRVIETGGRIENYFNDVYYGIGGLRGDLGSNLHYDVFAQYGLTRRHQDLLNDLDYNKISQAINAVPGATGPACADPSGGCVPLNLFTNAAITPAALKYVLANGAQDNRYTQFVAGGSLSGDLGFIRSPFATKAAAFAVGAEYRRESGSQAVDANYGSGNLIYYGQGTAVPNASFNVKEVYGELKLPLVTDKPFFQSLNIEGGARYSYYTNNTTTGTNHFKETTYKFGGDWTPVNGLRFRAVFNRAVRDPNIAELNQPLTQSGTDVLQTDPCAGKAPVGNAKLAALCIAQGAPAAFVNGGLIQDVIANQTNINSGGNTKLRPEKSNTITAGVVFSPTWLRGLNLTVDYYKVKISDYIATDSAQDISNQCFTNNIASYCALFVRNALNGQLTGSSNAQGIFPGINESAINIASLQTQGIDVTADYRFKVGNDKSLTLNFAGTYVGQWLFTPSLVVPSFSCAGRYGNQCSLNNGNPIPRWKHTAAATYDDNNWSLQVRWRMIGAVSEDDLTTLLVSHIPSYSYFDSTLQFKVAKSFTFRVGAQNIFNIQPPVVGGSAGSSGTNSGNTFPNVYDALGRTFFAGATVKF
jgi:outer membrane receptor protein involved in Fe transport